MSARRGTVRTLVLAVVLVLLPVGAATAATSLMGDEPIARNLINSPNVTSCPRSNPAAVDGTIDAIDYYSGAAPGTLVFSVVDSERRVTWRSEPFDAPTAGLGRATFDPVAVRAGDSLCIWSDSFYTADLDVDDDVDEGWFARSSPDVGDEVTETGGRIRQSISATITPDRPSSKDACKDGGWTSFGAGFENQGQCVASVVRPEHAGRR